MANRKTKNKNARILVGTSSFSSKDWAGSFYPEGIKPAEFLRYYSQQFNTVEIDATYYSVPSERTLQSWVYNTPEDFIISAKFPRAIVHAGDGSKPDANAVLTPDATYEIRDRFLEIISGLGKRLGTLVLQFPYFSRQHFSSGKLFYERLNTFLDDLPNGFSYGVEIRNRNWLKPEFADLLRKHNVTMVLADQAWMPHGDEVEQMFDPVTSDHLYVRLIGDRKEIEAITKTWEKEVIDRTDSLMRWAAMLTRMYRRQVNSLVYINNHYAGHAPATVRTLSKMVDEAIKIK
jgi:uncharacterized protein YecE (DUF72 family)